MRLGSCSLCIARESNKVADSVSNRVIKQANKVPILQGSVHDVR